MDILNYSNSMREMHRNVHKIYYIRSSNSEYVQCTVHTNKYFLYGRMKDYGRFIPVFTVKLSNQHQLYAAVNIY